MTIPRAGVLPKNGGHSPYLLEEGGQAQPHSNEQAEDQAEGLRAPPSVKPLPAPVSRIQEDCREERP